MPLQRSQRQNHGNPENLENRVQDKKAKEIKIINI
jgi:hypothetical protein